MLIVEGPDLVGKTTLCLELIRRLNADGLKHVYRHLTVLPKGWDFYGDYVPHIARPVVQDRFHMSELVYGRAVRGSTNITDDMLRLIEARVALAAGFTVVVTADWKVLEILWGRKQREEMFSLEMVQQVNKLYIQLVEGRFRHVSFDMHYHLTLSDMNLFDVTMPTQKEDFVERVIAAYEKRYIDVENLEPCCK